ncbi:MAG: hypothetical protein IJL41_06470 [Clostridia bacterium]|nr:hypothetical protein [Clostridia bacterium]
MDYKDYLDEAKKKLGETDALKNYRQFYESAVKRIKERRDSELAEIEKSYRDGLNEASAQDRILAKNADQYMASRGLARSGEAEQEYIDRSLAFAKKATSLAEGRRKSEDAARAGAENAISVLDKDYAEKANAENQRAYAEAAEEAKTRFEADREDERYRRESESERAEREYNITLARIKAELAEAAAQKEREFNAAEAAKKREYESAEAEKKRAYDASESEKKRAYELEKAKNTGGAQSSADAGKSGGYIPKQTASQLAKQIVSSRTASGTVSTVSEAAAVNDYLKELESENGIDESYMRDLKLALGSYGFFVPTQSDYKASEIAAQSEKTYKTVYDRARADYRRAGDPDADKKAKTAAQNAQIQFCREKCETYEQFVRCCRECGISDAVIARFTASNPPEKSAKATESAVSGAVSAAKAAAGGKENTLK